MSFEAADQPQDLPCGVIDQAWLDQLNAFRSKTFECVLDLQTALEGLIQDLPSIICNEVSPRFFQGQSSGTNSASVTLPAGGTWCYTANVFGINDDGVLVNGNNIRYFFFDTGSDDEILFGGSTGVRAGGQTISINQANFDNVMLQVKAYRVDCP